MKRKTPVKLIGYLLCVALLCGLLAGCGNDKVQEEQNDNASADTIPEDVVVHTGYGDLHYPDRWQEYVTIRQEQNGNTIAVTFETKSGEETYELFMASNEFTVSAANSRNYLQCVLAVQDAATAPNEMVCRTDPFSIAYCYRRMQCESLCFSGKR